MRGRAIPFSVMERAGFVGFALVIGLFVIGLTNDIGRLTGEGFGVVGSGTFSGWGRSTRRDAAPLARRPHDRPRRSGSRSRTTPTASRSAPRTTRSRLTWGELRDRVDALAGGLAGLGVRRGDTVALMLANRPEFHIADLAAMTLGATPFSIYQTYSPEQIAYVVGDAGARVAIVEEQFLERFRAARRSCPRSST